MVQLLHVKYVQLINIHVFDALQTAVNLLHLFKELQELGHQHCQKGFSYELYCNSTREHVQQQVPQPSRPSNGVS